MAIFNGFIGPSYQLNSLNVSAQRAVNLYTQSVEMPDSGNKYCLLGTPGTELFATTPQTYIRGMWVANGRWFVVTYSRLYEINSNGTHTLRGDLPLGTGIVGMSDNGLELCIAMGEQGFILNLSTNTLTQITGDGWRGSYTVWFLDGRFIFTEPTSARFFWSGLYDGLSIDPLAFATAEGNPDNLVAAVAAYQEIYAFGTDSLEIYEDTGDADLPYQRIGGAVIEYGCAAQHSIAKVDNALMWLGRDSRGSGVIYRIAGYRPQRVSTHAVEQAIQGYSSIEDAVAYSYQEDGHIFYVINFTAADTTWTYDASTGLWHERGYLGIDGALERHRGNHHVYIYGNHYISDFKTGQIYKQANDIYSDNGQVIKRVRITPHLVDNKNRMRYLSLEVNMEAGVGNSDDEAPVASLAISRDGGHTYTSPRTTSIGPVGNYSQRVNWHQLGMGRDTVFKFDITGKTKVSLVSAFLEVQKTSR